MVQSMNRAPCDAPFYTWTKCVTGANGDPPLQARGIGVRRNRDGKPFSAIAWGHTFKAAPLDGTDDISLGTHLKERNPARR
jgi:hypothetical protein